MRKSALFAVAIAFLWAGAMLAQAPAPGQNQFTLAAAEDAVKALRNGLLSENQRQTLAVFDPGMPGYSELADQLASLFARYDGLRVYAHITQTAAEDVRGTATVEFTLEAAPADDTRLPVRRTAQLHLTFARTGNSTPVRAKAARAVNPWKIVALEPRDFFARFQ